MRAGVLKLRALFSFSSDEKSSVQILILSCWGSFPSTHSCPSVVCSVVLIVGVLYSAIVSRSNRDHFEVLELKTCRNSKINFVGCDIPNVIVKVFPEVLAVCGYDGWEIPAGDLWTSRDDPFPESALGKSIHYILAPVCS